MMIPPPIIVFLAKTALFNIYDLSSLKFLLCGAAPLALETEILLKERFKGDLTIIQGYGQTEASLGVLYGNVDSNKSGSVGHLVKGTYIKIVDENGNSLGPNKVGEIYLKGPLIMKGYLGDIEATKSIIDEQGWLHTGDLGYYDKDKFFFVVDRLKELIKYKGYQVPPAELEAILLTHLKIKDAGVIGIPHEAAGEIPFAFVVKQPNVELSEDEVKNFVKENASNAKWLRGGVKFIEEIPKNPSGKILRKELRKLFKSLKAKL
jgi:acyl-CoA synthetase (AMP-forming)/AMP-acid ligase II